MNRFTISASLCSTILVPSMALAQTSVGQTVFSNGGGTAAGNATVVFFTFGQPIAGPALAAHTGVYAGFWPGLPVAECYANCDGSTAAPVLNANDFQCFLNKFAAGDSYANCDQSTSPPILNANDFQCFLNKFAAGCP